MNSIRNEKRLAVPQVIAAVEQNAQALVDAEEKRYADAAREIVAAVHQHSGNRHFILLSGPTSSGKTTTAKRLQEAFAAYQTVTHVVSLDDFYLGYGHAPLLPNGNYDYESIEALDLERLHRCMTELLQNGQTVLPVFDFKQHCPAAEGVQLTLEDHAVVIFEGIHAFHPHVQSYLPPEMTSRLFINTLSRFMYQGEKWLSRRELRLIRRIVRDDRFRASPFSNTMKMWPQVLRGEDLYLFPYIDTADYVIDTTFAYEPCLLKERILPILQAVSPSDEQYATASYLQQRLSVFPSLSADVLPHDSMLHEFVG